ncbi:MAG TPA: pyruvate dehydrogenase (acetyl-transferring) E1 component subunit alpha [Armatimonadota bacterium]|jgi:pyruvate dehydrogenase E1 component alpha subunit
MNKSEVLDLYRQMLTIRRLEEKTAQAYSRGKVGGYLHLYIGQEAVAVGFISALRPDDYTIASYRDHGHYLAVGGDAPGMMAELYGRSTGICKGKGGSMHLFDAERHFLGGSGIVGAGIPIGTGAAMAIRYRGGDQVCLCFFGDGAMNQGVFHESLNMAALWNLPIIYICENNLYAMGTSVERSSSITDLVERSCGYDVERSEVDGMDLFAVRDLADRIVPEVRKTGKPHFVEAICYRYRGHGAADPGNYRTKEEVEEWRQKDPIGRVEQFLLDEKLATQEKLEAIDEEVKALAAQAADFADRSPEPLPEALYEDIYA